MEKLIGFHSFNMRAIEFPSNEIASEEGLDLYGAVERVQRVGEFSEPNAGSTLLLLVFLITAEFGSHFNYFPL